MARTLEDDPATEFDESGTYGLPLEAGVHVIREVVPEGFRQTFPASGAHDVLVEAEQTLAGIDFGNLPVVPASVHGTKWQDTDGDSTRDPDEPGLPGVIIFSDLNSNGALDPDEPGALTRRDDPGTAFDEAGRYWILGLEAGVHVIREVVPEGFQQTFPSARLHVVILEPGRTVDGVDFGNLPVVPGTIHGAKWEDADGDGARDAGEAGLEGVTVYLDLNNNGQLDAGEPLTLTMQDDPDTDFDESGLYWLTVVSPGVQVVREVVPDGFLQTFPRSGHHSLVLEPGQAIDGVDFGNQRGEGLGGLKWLDRNGNASRDQNEPGVGGVTVYVDANLNGQLDAGEPSTRTLEDDPSTIADESGRYRFPELEAGTHVIREVVPRGYRQTFPSQGYHVVVLEEGVAVEGIDFGNRRGGPRQ